MTHTTDSLTLPKTASVIASAEMTLAPKWAGQFTSHSQWVAKARSWLDDKAVCIDAYGRRCASGRDFARAQAEGAYPIRFFWDMTLVPATPTAPNIEQEKAAALNAVCSDSMTTRKAAMIAGRGGRKITGFILQPETGQASIVHLGAVRHIDNGALYQLLHPTLCVPRACSAKVSASTQEGT